jgi:DNA-binding transcriptional ArsR family regulator
MRATDDLSKIFTALGDPTRRALLARLAAGEVSVTDLAEPLDMTMGAVSKHLAVLEEAGLIERSRRAQFRPCRLTADPLGVAEAWLGWFRRHHEASFDRLENYLATLKPEGNPDDPR